jgi:ribosomal protein S27AE
MSRNRAYLAAAAVAGTAVVILGLMLADGQASPQPVIAVVMASGASPQQVEAMVADSQAHHAGMLLLYTSTWQQAAAVSQALSGSRSPMDISVLVSSSGSAAIASELPVAARVIDADGNLMRAGAAPGGPGLLVLLWACLLLLFAYLVTRVVIQLRPSARGPGPSITPGPQPSPAVAQSPAGAILASYLPPDPMTRWEPQCPRCGAFTAASAAVNGYECLSCGYRWPTADPMEWPNVVLSHRRRHDGSPPRPADHQGE